MLDQLTKLLKEKYKAIIVAESWSDYGNVVNFSIDNKAFHALFDNDFNTNNLGFRVGFLGTIHEFGKNFSKQAD